MNDPVNHPRHYTSHPSGIEVIEITRHMGFNLGNVVKYVLRCDLKADAVEDLRKARWYLDDEIAKREALADAVEAAAVLAEIKAAGHPTAEQLDEAHGVVTVTPMCCLGYASCECVDNA